jgi:hypothetical protein
MESLVIENSVNIGRVKNGAYALVAVISVDGNVGPAREENGENSDVKA